MVRRSLNELVSLRLGSPALASCSIAGLKKALKPAIDALAVASLEVRVLRNMDRASQ